MVTVDGGPVVAHAQAFADEINRRWGFTHIMTYPGHEPDQQHALDNFQTRDVMLQLADWCTHDDVIDQYGIDYVIFNVDESTVGGEIYNREIARYWRHMEDRGSPTQNHHDHVHVSFNPTAKGPFGPSTFPTPQPAAVPVHLMEESMFTVPSDAKAYDVPIHSWVKRIHVQSNGTKAKVAVTDGKNVLFIHDQDWFGPNDSFAFDRPAKGTTLEVVNWGSSKEGSGSDTLHVAYDVA